MLKPYHPDFFIEPLHDGLWDRFCWSTFLYIAVHIVLCVMRVRLHEQCGKMLKGTLASMGLRNVMMEANGTIKLHFSPLHLHAVQMQNLLGLMSDSDPVLSGLVCVDSHCVAITRLPAAKINEISD